MTKRLSLAFFLSCMLTLINAQQSYVDSLKVEVEQAREDTNKVWLLIDLAGNYQWSYPDSGIFYAQKALELAKEINFAAGAIIAYQTLGESLAGKGNYPKALEAALRALEFSEKLGDSARIIWSFAYIGGVYFYSGDYSKALYYYSKTKSNPAIYRYREKFLSGFLGESYFHLHQPDSALYYMQKSYDLDKKSTVHWPVPYFYMGDIYSDKKMYRPALDYYREGFEFADNALTLANGYIGVAAIFKRMNREDSAIYYGSKAVSVAKNSSFFSQTIKGSELLTGIYKTNRRSDSAIKYMEIMLEAKDSLLIQARQNLSVNEQMHQQEMQQLEHENMQERKRIRQWRVTVSLAGLVLVFLLIMLLQWRNSKQKKKANLLLLHQKEKLENTLSELKTTQSQLIQSEKMASLGELTAGIAHEIQNPLNFVNNFSDVNKELLLEMKDEITNGNFDDAKAIANNVIDNEEKINHHGKRADAIVKGMLQHSRASSGQKEPTDINALADEYLRLAFHGLRAKDKAFNSKTEVNFDQSIGKINVVPQEIGRVILNLINNAFYAVDEKKKSGTENYEPTVSISTKKEKDKIEIKVKDNGNGISKKVLDKIFQPFFTTKPTGQGTGLGLSLSYDIVKAHGGELKVETKEGEGPEFIIQIPVAKINES